MGYTKFRSDSALLKDLEKQYGTAAFPVSTNCINCLRAGNPSVKSASCGWVFQRDTMCEHTHRSFTQEIWVVVIRKCKVCGDEYTKGRVRSDQDQ